MRIVPVTVVVGFLEAGKTTFIQKILESDAVNPAEQVLVLTCEEGGQQYRLDMARSGNVKLLCCETQEDLNKDQLFIMTEQLRLNRVLVEYNGMWPMDALLSAFPENWRLSETVSIFDSSTFELYYKNMKQLVYDKLRYSDRAVFNRVTANFDRMAAGRCILQMSDSAEVYYEYLNGEIVCESAFCEFPQARRTDTIAVADDEFASFYRAAFRSQDKLEGKRLSIRGKIYSIDANRAVIGRDMLVCCMSDLALAGYDCRGDALKGFSANDWVNVTGIAHAQYSGFYNRRGPVLFVEEATLTTAPLMEIATFN